METENNKIFNRVQYKYIFNRLLKLGAFDGLGQTPFESVRLAPVESALSLINDENAMM